MGQSTEGTGENREVNIPTASDVTFFFQGGTDQQNKKTSADDTATEKYTDTPISAKRYQIRPDETIGVVSINGDVFTEPITITVLGGTEMFDNKEITYMVIRTLTDNTNIKLRVR